MHTQHETELQIFGMVEELLIDDDPEHDWRDRIRSSRVSNEQRQLLLYQLSGRIRRLIGKKVQDTISSRVTSTTATSASSNALSLSIGHNYPTHNVQSVTKRIVLGYSEHFDLEDDNIIVRGLGTQCRLIHTKTVQHIQHISMPSSFSSHSLKHFNDLAIDLKEELDTTPNSASVQTTLRREALNNIFDSAIRNPAILASSIGSPPNNLHRSPIKSPTECNISNPSSSQPQEVEKIVEVVDNIDIIVCTMKSFVQGQVKYMAGVVQARAIKVLSDMKLEELGKERDAWWQEVRQEIRENARMLSCTHVIGYTEKAYIHSKGNVCILSAEGTAAIVDSSTTIDANFHHQPQKIDCSIFHIPEGKISPFAQAQQHENQQRKHCQHDSPGIPKEGRCGLCYIGRVPEMLLSTCELPPAHQALFTKQHFIEARIYRSKKRKIGESNGEDISQILPFAEYYLHKQLLYKMKLYHVNAVFNLSYSIAMSDFSIIVTVQGTGVHIPALPESPILEFDINEKTKASKRLNNVHKQLQALSQHFNNVDILTPKELLQQRQQSLIQQQSRHKQLREHREAKKGKRRKDTEDSSESEPFDSPSDSEDEQEIKMNDKTEESSSDEDKVKDSLETELAQHQQVQVVGSLRKSSLENESSMNAIKRPRSQVPHHAKAGYLVEIDDEMDEDNMIALMDPLLPATVSLSSFKSVSSLGRMSLYPLSPTKRSTTNKNAVYYSHNNLQNIVIQKRYSLLNVIDDQNNDSSTMIPSAVGFQEYLSALYHDLYTTLAFKLQLIVSGNNQKPLKVCGLNDDISFISEHEVLISLQAMAIVDNNQVGELVLSQPNLSTIIPELLPQQAFMPEANVVNAIFSPNIELSESEESDDKTVENQGMPDEMFEMDPETQSNTGNTVSFSNMPISRPINNNLDECDSSDEESSQGSIFDDEQDLQWINEDYVTITPLYFVPGARIKTVLGKVSQHLIRESESVVDFGTFQQEVIMESNAVIRAHTKALGANALLNYQIVYHKVLDNQYRKQAYTLLTVSGDAAKIEFEAASRTRNKKRRPSGGDGSPVST